MSRWLAVIGLLGCAHQVQVQVVSDPVGARIIDVKTGGYLCDAPCSISVVAHGGVEEFTTVKAQPTRAQDCEQTTRLSTANVPQRIFFDMKVCPINRNLNGTMSG